MSQRNFNAAELPDHAFGSRTVLGWGAFGLLAVEATVFATLIATCLYGMGRADVWPPPPFQPPQLSFGVINTAILGVSLGVNLIYKRAAERFDLRVAQRCLAAMLALELAFLVVRGFELRALEVRWDDNFYGSILWVMLGFHTLHLFADFVETAVLLILSFRRGIRPHRFSDMSNNALFWYFAGIVWVPLFVLIYILPRMG